MLYLPSFMLDRTFQPGDPLSDTLSLAGLECAPAARFELGGSWFIDFPADLPLKFGSVMDGTCCLQTEEGTEPIQLNQGDCYVVTGSCPCEIYSDVRAEISSARTFFRKFLQPDGVVRFGDSVDVVLLAAGFTLRGNSSLLLDELPPILVIRAGSTPASLLLNNLHQLAEERTNSQLGQRLMAESLSQVVLLQVLREFARSTTSFNGLLKALNDPKIAHVLRLMHGNFNKRWSLGELAAEVAMSRSSFASRFRALVGRAPADYLLKWRMQRAGNELRTTDKTIMSIAIDYGYASDSAFSNSFKRTMGCSPKDYRRNGFDDAHACAI
jgi:AraC-like DNA-binding protein